MNHSPPITHFKPSLRLTSTCNYSNHTAAVTLSGRHVAVGRAITRLPCTELGARFASGRAVGDRRPDHNLRICPNVKFHSDYGGFVGLKKCTVVSICSKVMGFPLLLLMVRVRPSGVMTNTTLSISSSGRWSCRNNADLPSNVKVLLIDTGRSGLNAKRVFEQQPALTMPKHCAFACGESHNQTHVCVLSICCHSGG
jgi:hypothetical protein